MSFNLFASDIPVLPPVVADGVYPIPSTLEEVSNGVWIVQGTDGRTYQISEPAEDGTLRFLSLTGKYDYIFDMFQDLDKYIDFPDSSNILGSNFRENEKIAFPDEEIPIPSGNYLIFNYGGDDQGLTFTNKNVYVGVTDMNITRDDERTTYKFNCLSVIKYRWIIGTRPFRYSSAVSSGGAQSVGLAHDRVPHNQTVYTNAFPTSMNVSQGWHVEMGYTGYGDPAKGITPENDPFNPESPLYDKQVVDDIMNSVLNLNMRIKIDWSEFWPEFDKRLPALKVPDDVEDDEEEDVELDVKDKVGKKNKLIFDNALKNLTGKIDKIQIGDTGSSDEEVDDSIVKEESVLTFPFKILKRFADGVTSIEKNDTIVFPSITWGEYTFNEPIEVSFNQIIADCGLTEVHKIYYLLTNAYFTFLLVNYAKKKISEFAQGKGDLM